MEEELERQRTAPAARRSAPARGDGDPKRGGCRGGGDGGGGVVARGGGGGRARASPRRRRCRSGPRRLSGRRLERRDRRGRGARRIGNAGPGRSGHAAEDVPEEARAPRVAARLLAQIPALGVAVQSRRVSAQGGRPRRGWPRRRRRGFTPGWSTSRYRRGACTRTYGAPSGRRGRCGRRLRRRVGAMRGRRVSRRCERPKATRKSESPPTVFTDYFLRRAQFYYSNCQTLLSSRHTRAPRPPAQPLPFVHSEGSNNPPGSAVFPGNEHSS